MPVVDEASLPFWDRQRRDLHAKNPLQTTSARAKSRLFGNGNYDMLPGHKRQNRSLWEGHVGARGRRGAGKIRYITKSEKSDHAGDPDIGASTGGCWYVVML